MTNCPLCELDKDRQGAIAWMNYMEKTAKRGGIIKMRFDPNAKAGEGRWEITPSLFTRSKTTR